MRRLLTLLLAILAIAIAFTAPQPQRASAVELGKIMPLGDSITAGYTGTGGVPGGYRQQLFRNLTAAGCSFQFVGSQTTYASSVLTDAGQGNHEGHNGYTIQQIIDGVEKSSWLSVNPDIILLHIGANDILNPDAATAPDRLDALLGSIFAKKPDASIFVAKIIGGSTVDNGLQASTYDNGIVDYNAAIAQKVAARAQNGQRVSLVDMYSLMNIDHQTDGQGRPLFADTSHPSQIGYDLMGDAWANAIKAAEAPEPGPLAMVLGAGAVVAGLHLWRNRAQPVLCRPFAGKRVMARPSSKNSLIMK